MTRPTDTANGSSGWRADGLLRTAPTSIPSDDNESEPTMHPTDPIPLADETWLIPNLLPAGPEAFVPVNSLLIRGREPIIVDTGAPAHRAAWFETVFSLVDPDDVRWVFVSHEELDHFGNARELLDRCRNALLVSCFFLGERVAAEAPLPHHRLRWVEPGDALEVGDRSLRVVRPPLYDAPTTRGLHDPTTGVLWAVDSFAAPTPGAVVHADDLPADLYDGGFREFNSMLAPWHTMVDPDAFARHIDTTRSLAPTTVVSAHGPILTEAAIDDAFERTLALAGQPAAVPPGQGLLDELLAMATAAN
jgi:flavorubredoxin